MSNRRRSSVIDAKDDLKERKFSFLGVHEIEDRKTKFG